MKEQLPEYNKGVDAAAPSKEVAAIVLNSARFKPLIVSAKEVYTPEGPVSKIWRGKIAEDVVLGKNAYSREIHPYEVIKTHHQARREYLENMGI